MEGEEKNNNKMNPIDNVSLSLHLRSFFFLQYMRANTETYT